MPVEMVRIMGLDTAAQLLGKGRLADELCITVRALNYKIDAGRGVSDADVVAAARGLEERAKRFLDHAQKLRAVVSPAASDTVAVAPLSWVSVVLAHCDHVERFEYDRDGFGPDASPHALAAAARILAKGIIEAAVTRKIDYSALFAAAKATVDDGCAERRS